MVDALRNIVGYQRWIHETFASGSSGTWTNPGNIIDGFVYLTACAGGGSGGTDNAAGDGGGGGGGGACCSNYKMYVGTANQTYSVGAGGASVTGGGAVKGNDGGNTQFGYLFFQGGEGGWGDGYGGDGGGIYPITPQTPGSDPTDRAMTIRDSNSTLTDVTLRGIGGVPDAEGYAAEGNGALYGGGGGGGGAQASTGGHRGGGSIAPGGIYSTTDEGAGGGSLGPGGGDSTNVAPGYGGGGQGGEGDTDSASQAGGDGVIFIRYEVAG